MLQKIFLTFLLVQSTGILIATHVPDPQSPEDRVTWRHVPLSITSVVLASQIVARSPFIPFPIACIALAGCAAVITAPDDVKKVLNIPVEMAAEGYRHTRILATQKIILALNAIDKHLEKKK